MSQELAWNVTRASAVIRWRETASCEAWVLEDTIINKLMVFDREVLRRIFGPTKERDGTWRIKTIR
jgi:hypothetical protein